MDPERIKKILAIFYEAAKKYSEIIKQLNEFLQGVGRNLSEFLLVAQDILENINMVKKTYSRAPKVIKPSKLYLEDKRNKLFYCRNNC